MPTPRLRTVVAAGLAALASAAGCRPPTDAAVAPRAARTVRDLDEARAQWARSRPAAYDVTIRRVCFCLARPLAVSVRGTTVVAVRDPATGAPLAPAPYETVLTVDALFAHLDDAVARRAAHVAAEYDPTRGFPQRTYVDYEAALADEELGFELSDFTPR